MVKRLRFSYFEPSIDSNPSKDNIEVIFFDKRAHEKLSFEEQIFMSENKYLSILLKPIDMGHGIGFRQTDFLPRFRCLASTKVSKFLSK